MVIAVGWDNKKALDLIKRLFYGLA